jgi:citrate lyase subunit beta/citryl-CoA lyase/(S)-citramalyl-CoA lyase
LLPKVHHPSEVAVCRSLIGALPAPPELYTFIETIEAVDNADGIASLSDALCFGQADLVSEMYSPNEAFIDHARARLCIAAAKYNIPAIDTNSFEIKDMAHLAAECVASRAYGFTGKAAIHPAQVSAINDAFAVSSEMLGNYESMLAEYSNATTGFRVKDGEVIAPPFVAKARRMLKLYRQR